jgi:hypothetical protein
MFAAQTSNKCTEKTQTTINRDLKKNPDCALNIEKKIC